MSRAEETTTQLRAAAEDEDLVERLRVLRRKARSDRDAATLAEAVGRLIALREAIQERTDQLVRLMG